MPRAIRRHNPIVQPILKWAGGKRQLLPEISKYIPELITMYYEPFAGGAAVLFSLQPTKAVINDSNAELVNVYNVIKDYPDELINDLQTHRNEENYFYRIRELDRTPDFNSLTDIQRASRIIFLNKTCYNGLFRVNQQGQFNAPFGKYKNPNIVNDVIVRAVCNYLRENDVKILNGDFELCVENAQRGSFVYFDPPYMPLSDSSNFTGYTLDGFDQNDQVRLKNLCDRLNNRGVKFLLSNSAAPFILDLYRDFKIEIVGATRTINSAAEKRGEVAEVLVRNYECKQFLAVGASCRRRSSFSDSAFRR